jgi:hypothetical protein
MMMLCMVGLALSLGTAGCSNASGDSAVRSGADAAPAAVLQASMPDTPARQPLTDAERAMYQDMAKLSWQYLDTYYQPATGMVNATPDWANTTVWDIGGQILAYLGARDLGLITPAEYDKRTRTLLNTMEKAELFRGAAYNKL